MTFPNRQAISIGRARPSRYRAPELQYLPIRVIWNGSQWRRIYKWGSPRSLAEAARAADRKAEELGLPIIGMTERQNHP